jgi:hypothetical protein
MANEVGDALLIISAAHQRLTANYGLEVLKRELWEAVIRQQHQVDRNV